MVIKSRTVNVSVEVKTKRGGRYDDVATQVHFDWAEGRRIDREECTVEVHTDGGLVHSVKVDTHSEESEGTTEVRGGNEEEVVATVGESSEEITLSESGVLESLDTEVENSEEEHGSGKSKEEQESVPSDVQDRKRCATRDSVSQTGLATYPREGRWCNGVGRGARRNISADSTMVQASRSRRLDEGWTSRDAGDSATGEEERSWRSPSVPTFRQWWKNAPRRTAGAVRNSRGNYGRRGALRGWRV